MKNLIKQWLGIEIYQSYFEAQINEVNKVRAQQYEELHSKIYKLSKDFDFLKQQLGFDDGEKKNDSVGGTIFITWNGPKDNRKLLLVDKFEALLKHLKLEWHEEEKTIKGFKKIK